MDLASRLKTGITGGTICPTGVKSLPTKSRRPPSRVVGFR